MTEHPELAALTRDEMRARAIGQLDQAAAVHLEVEADLRAYNAMHPHKPVAIPPRPAWLVRLLAGNGNGGPGE